MISSEFNKPFSLYDLSRADFERWSSTPNVHFLPTGDEAMIKARHDEAVGTAILSEQSRGVLFLLDQKGAIPAQELEKLAGGYEDWRAVFNVVGAGWANASDMGIAINKERRKVTKVIFDS